MGFTVSFSTDNSAFHDELPVYDPYMTRLEVIRILGKVRAELSSGKMSGSCIDANGNVVGKWGLEASA